MKKFFIKDLASMVEKEIVTEFLLRNVKLSIADGRRWQDLTLSDKSGIVYGKCWSEHISDETDNYVGKLSVSSEKLSFSESSVCCGLSESLRLKHMIRQISGLLCPATIRNKVSSA